MADYKTLTELTALEGNVLLTDLILISRYEKDINADYVSYHAPVLSFASALSGSMQDQLAKYVQKDLKELAYLNHDQIEAEGSNPLTSYIEQGDAGRKDSADLYAISAIIWDNKKKITKVEGIDLKALSASILDDVVNILKKRGINDGFLFDDNTSKKGVKLATLNGNEIYSGDPRLQIKVDSLTNNGTAIAKVKYSDNEVILIKNDLSAKTIAPDFGNKIYCGDKIAEISGITIRNNLSVTTKSKIGDCIACINGNDIYNNLQVTPVEIGSPIANINGTTIKNGVTVTGITNIGKKICTISNQDIYNNVDVTDNVSRNGDCIATVNGVNIYNNIVVTTDKSKYLTYINGTAVLGGVKVGTVTPKTYTGDIIATIETDSGTANIYNGNSYKDVLNRVYPVGSIYLTIDSRDPSVLFGFGSWTQVSQGRCLWGTSNTSEAGGTIEAGLPDHYHSVTYQVSDCGCKKAQGIRNSHSASTSSITTGYASASNSIYGKSSTVQPPAFKVNIWKRTA